VFASAPRVANRAQHAAVGLRSPDDLPAAACVASRVSARRRRRVVVHVARAARRERSSPRGGRRRPGLFEARSRVCGLCLQKLLGRCALAGVLVGKNNAFRCIEVFERGWRAKLDIAVAILEQPHHLALGIVQHLRVG
jgi:hypothetical protein